MRVGVSALWIGVVSSVLCDHGMEDTIMCGPLPIRFSWCSRVVGWQCHGPTHHSVADVSPPWGGRVGIRTLELRLSGARQQPDRAKQGVPQHNPNHGERGQITMSMRHAAPRRTNAVSRRPLKRSSEIILAAVIYLTASCFAVAGTLGVVAAIWVLWGALVVR